MKQFIKKFIGEILLISGIGILTYNIFNFYHTYTNYQGGYYYYNTGTLSLIAIGAMLMTMGILIIKNK